MNSADKIYTIGHRRRLSLKFSPRGEHSGSCCDFNRKYKEQWQSFICKQWGFLWKDLSTGKTRYCLHIFT